MEDILKDKRFAHIVKDPRFRKMPRQERKTKIDNRFKGMFTDNKFKLKCSVDKRGRPLKLSSNENLKRFYDISSSESESDEDSSSDEKEEETSQNRDNMSNSEDGSDSGETGSSEGETNENSDDEDEEPEKGKHKKYEGDDERFQIDNIKNDTSAKSNKKNKKDKKEEVTGEGTSFKKEKSKIKKDEENQLTKLKKKKGKKSRDEENDDEDSDSAEDRNELLSQSALDFARGEAELSSSSDEDDYGGDGTDEEEDELIHNWAELDDNVGEVDESTSRLAICNLDWDRIGSKDIFTALNSFKPNNGIIRSVKVYVSEYGKERMAQEKAEGPKELKAIKLGDVEDERILEDKMVQESFTENLRRYQFNRLRYYYGVVECDSVGTADHIYKECDGNEYETSCTKFDLRFIPEDMEFDEGDMRSECGEMPHGYLPDAFKNYAMAFSKAELTWDETDRNRQSLVSKQFTDNPDDIKEDDLKAYLADSSDEEERDYSKLIEGQSDSGSDSDQVETEDKQIDKYKRLLLDLDNEKKDKIKGDVQMEITWEMGLKETTEELVKKKSQTSDKTLWDKQLEKKKEKKKEKRKEKKKKKELEEDSGEEEQDKEDFATFSDDDVPADLGDDPFFANELGDTDVPDKNEKVKKKKKKDKMKEPTQEEEEEKAALSLLMMDEEDNKKHFNLKNIIENDNTEGKKKKKKKKNKKEEVKTQEDDDFQLNVEDPRFSAVYESHLYNIDPSAPEYKKTKGSEALVTEKLKRSADPGKRKRSNKDNSYIDGKKSKLDDSEEQQDHSLALLVKSVKAKTKSFQSSKSRKER